MTLVVLTATKVTREKQWVLRVTHFLSFVKRHPRILASLCTLRSQKLEHETSWLHFILPKTSTVHRSRRGCDGSTSLKPLCNVFQHVPVSLSIADSVRKSNYCSPLKSKQVTCFSPRFKALLRKGIRMIVTIQVQL